MILKAGVIRKMLKTKELMDQIMIDSDRAFEKGTVSRARSARKSLSEVAKLCKNARKELLEKVIHEKQKDKEK